MPKELPKVDLEDPSDLDYIADAVRRYALDVGKERLRARSQRGGASALEETMAQALDRVRLEYLRSGSMQRGHASCTMS